MVWAAPTRPVTHPTPRTLSARTDAPVSRKHERTSVFWVREWGIGGHPRSLEGDSRERYDTRRYHKSYPPAWIVTTARDERRLLTRRTDVCTAHAMFVV